MTARQLTQILIRAAVLLIVIVIIMLFLPEILFQIPYGWTVFWDRPIYSLRDEIVVGIPLLAIAATLWVFQARLARWIVPRFPRCCDECGYSLKNLNADRWPECGTDVRGRS